MNKYIKRISCCDTMCGMTKVRNKKFSFDSCNRCDVFVEKSAWMWSYLCVCSEKRSSILLQIKYIQMNLTCCFH